MSRINSKGKKMKTLEKIFQEINKRHVRIKKQEKIHNNDVLYTVLEDLLKRMREYDSLFDSMKPKLEYLGSYFDGLRVGQPTEYDLNVVLTIHVDYNKIILESTKNAYTAIKMPEEFRRLCKMSDSALKGFEQTKDWCDSCHRLVVKSFRSWMQRVVDGALNLLPVQDNKRVLEVKGKCYKLYFTTSGPANTITIHMDDGYVIDVDLVPTLQFQLPKVPYGSSINFGKVTKTEVPYYFAVPKPTDDDVSWRLAFPYQERFYIDNNNNLKSTIKLLKLFRDVQEFNKLASYFIKTMFLWETEEKGDTFWKNNSLAFLVLHSLGKLRDCLAIARINNFWCPEHNLLEKINPTTCKIWANRITNIINDINRNKQKNPHILLKYFVKNKTNVNKK